MPESSQVIMGSGKLQPAGWRRTGLALWATTLLATAAPLGLATAQTTGVQSGTVQDLQRQIQSIQRRHQDELRTLTERLQQLEKTQTEQTRKIEEVQTAAPEVRVQPSRDNITLELSGRINQAFLFADNGEESQSFIVDNDNSGSRIGFTGEGAISDDITMGVYLEAGFEVNTTDEISFGDEGPVGTTAGDSDFLLVRHAEWYVKSERYGELWLGFGNLATEEVSEVDLSGTDCCVSASDVDDIAGGLEFENGDEVDSYFSNLDGERTSRIAYFSPSYNGFSVGVAARQEDETIQPDISLRYAADIFTDWEVAGAVGWRPDRNALDERDSDTFHGSFSVLSPMGISFTAAGGVETIEDDDGDLGDIIDDDDDADDITNENFFFVKLGYQAELLPYGDTRFAIDYFNGNSLNDAVLTGDATDTMSIGGGVVQVISDAATEIYIGARYYDVELGDPTSDPNPFDLENPDELSMVVFFTGARVRF